MDTRNKRASVLGLALASLAILPAPSSTPGAEVRQQLAYSYAGITTDTTVTGTAAVTVPAPTVAVTARGVHTGTAAVAVLAPTVAASGTIATPNAVGTIAVSVPGPTVSIWGWADVGPPRTRPTACGAASPWVTAPGSTGPRVVAGPGGAGTLRLTGTSSVAVPAPTVAVIAIDETAPRVGTAAVTVPAPTVSGSGGMFPWPVSFVWDAVVGADDYHLRIGTGPGLSDFYAESVGYVLTATVELGSGTWYCRVVPFTLGVEGTPTAEQIVVLG